LIVRASLSTDADITAPHWKFFPSHIQWSNFSCCSAPIFQ